MCSISVMLAVQGNFINQNFHIFQLAYSSFHHPTTLVLYNFEETLPSCTLQKNLAPKLPDKGPHPWNLTRQHVYDIYKHFCKTSHDVVGINGCIVLRKLLTLLEIPFLDLEDYMCVPYDLMDKPLHLCAPPGEPIRADHMASNYFHWWQKRYSLPLPQLRRLNIKSVGVFLAIDGYENGNECFVSELAFAKSIIPQIIWFKYPIPCNGSTGNLEQDVLKVYNQFCKPTDTVIGVNGCKLLRRLLTALKISFVELQDFGFDPELHSQGIQLTNGTCKAVIAAMSWHILRIFQDEQAGKVNLLESAVCPQPNLCKQDWCEPVREPVSNASRFITLQEKPVRSETTQQKPILSQSPSPKPNFFNCPPPLNQLNTCAALFKSPSQSLQSCFFSKSQEPSLFQGNLFQKPLESNAFGQAILFQKPMEESNAFGQANIFQKPMESNAFLPFSQANSFQKPMKSNAFSQANLSPKPMEIDGDW